VTYTAETPQKLREALAAAKNETTTTVIYVPVESQERVRGFEGWWNVPIAEVSEQPDVIEARDDYESAISSQRWHV
jgi:3D-(3,5/4)-trihydroxycyclohexane-1,2-dione acylhydrolase (decyclizing)